MQTKAYWFAVLRMSHKEIFCFKCSILGTNKCLLICSSRTSTVNAILETLSFRGSAVRQTYLFLYLRVELRASLKLLEDYSTMVPNGLRGSHNWAPIMPSYASVSDSHGIFFSVKTRVVNTRFICYVYMNKFNT